MLINVEPFKFTFFAVNVLPTSKLHDITTEDITETDPWICILEKNADWPNVDKNPCRFVGPPTFKRFPIPIDDGVDILDPKNPVLNTSKESPTIILDAVDKRPLILKLLKVHTVPRNSVDPFTCKNPPAINEDIVEILFCV